MQRFNLQVPEHSSSLFHFDAATKELIAEANTISQGSRRAIDSRCWNDACDVGFSIRSAHTGIVKQFCLWETKRDRDGDVQVWIYRAIDGSGFTAHILND